MLEKQRILDHLAIWGEDVWVHLLTLVHVIHHLLLVLHLLEGVHLVLGVHIARVVHKHIVSIVIP